MLPWLSQPCIFSAQPPSSQQLHDTPSAARLPLLNPLCLTSPATILYCRCAYAQVVPTGVKNEVLQKLCDSNASFETVSDLCEMAAHRDPRLQAIASCGSLRIAACYPRAVKGLFQQAGFPLPADTEILNMRTQTAQEIADALLSAEAAPAA